MLSISEYYGIGVFGRPLRLTSVHSSHRLSIVMKESADNSGNCHTVRHTDTVMWGNGMTVTEVIKWQHFHSCWFQCFLNYDSHDFNIVSSDHVIIYILPVHSDIPDLWEILVTGVMVCGCRLFFWHVNSDFLTTSHSFTSNESMHHEEGSWRPLMNGS